MRSSTAANADFPEDGLVRKVEVVADRRFGAVLLLVLLFGCGNDPSVVERPGQPAAVRFANNDDEMAAAIQQARESIQGFLAELRALRDRGSYFAVKVPISVSGGHEHVWLGYPDFNNGTFQGAIGNDPIAGSLKLGDKITTPFGDISDWMAVRDGELYGGFTIVVARARMTATQRAEFDASVPFRVPALARRF